MALWDRRRRLPFICGILLLWGCSGAQYLHEEPPAGTIPAGKVVYVDDGTCPAGEVKQLTGGSLQTGVARQVRCVPRPR